MSPRGAPACHIRSVAHRFHWPVLLLLIFVVVVFDIVNFFVIINVVDELSRPSIHKLAIANLMLRLRLFFVLISVLMFIVISYSEVFCRWIPRYFLKCNPDLPWWMYLQPWPFMNGRANESDWNPNWFFHCWHIAFLILWTHLTKINQVICVFFRLSWYIN